MRSRRHAFAPGATFRPCASPPVLASGCSYDPDVIEVDCVNDVVTSPDGASWVEGEFDGSVSAFAPTPSIGFVAVGRADEQAASWWSTDGLTWEHAVYPDSAVEGFTATAAVANGVIAAEAALDQDGAPRIWHTLDGGMSWILIAELKPIPGQRDATVLALAFRGAQYFVLGHGWRGTGEPAAWRGP